MSHGGAVLQQPVLAPKMKSSGWNRDIALALVFIVMGLTFLRVSADPSMLSWIGGDVALTPGIGSLLRESGNVRIRPAASAIWKDVGSAKQEISDGETVFTGDNSTARIDIRSLDKEAIVLPNSLVVIRLSDLANSDINYDIRKGGIHVIAKNLSKMHFTANGHEVNINPRQAKEEFDIRVDDEKMDKPIQVLSSLDPPPAPPAPPAPKTIQIPAAVAPALAAKFEPGEIQFSWQRGTGSETEFTLRRTDIPEAEKSLKSSDDHLAVALVAGQYSWKLRSRDKDLTSAWTTESNFSVEAKPKLKILPTFQIGDQEVGTRMDSSEDLNSVHYLLRWDSVEGTNKYLVEVFKGEKMIQSGETEKPEFPITITHATQYSFRVSTHLASGEQIQSDQVAIRVKLSPPVAKSPEADHRFNPGESALMTWEKTSLTQLYEFQVATDAKFKNLVEDRKSEKNFYVLKKMKDGATYFWRIRSGNDGSWSDWTESRVFRYGLDRDLAATPK